MKEIERFLNHLYYAAYCMTAWISFVPNRGKYEENIEQGWIIHGLFFFYIIDILIFLLALGEFLSGYNIASISNNYLWFSIVLMVFAIILDWVVFHYFVYRKKKYNSIICCSSYSFLSNNPVWTYLCSQTYIKRLNK